MKKQPLVILTGPTAVGKTALSIALAKAVGGEIISADSMQVYRYMDIGSAKITKADRKGVTHYLIDVLDPGDEFDVFTFQQMAKKALGEISARGKLPIVVGGTGFYIQALLYDIQFAKEADDGRIRRELIQIGMDKGNEYLHRLLWEADPEAAGQIHANNRKRVIRALEYYRLTGEKISVHNRRERKKQSPYEYYYYVVNTERKALYERIDARVEQMMRNGLEAEVSRLKGMGCNSGMVSMQGLGYKEMLNYLDGQCTLEEAVCVIKRETRHFAKRQITWFRREKNVRWIDLPAFHHDQEQVLAYMLKDMEPLLRNGDTGNAADTAI